MARGYELGRQSIAAKNQAIAANPNGWYVVSDESGQRKVVAGPFNVNEANVKYAELCATETAKFTSYTVLHEVNAVNLDAAGVEAAKAAQGSGVAK